ncbi:ImmA/IrrE family metallo-endopeptidase [Sphingomonas sp. 8AM]|uniref:ImmA/IrrE family metallo-endopeptidase n=1 Tax=Sphingomonas sp. 8AM TaxID=2653170 RepID=UPI0012F36448|nr:ImmA/IrrE family metallo-endopeptidase [Sphingomonas sp. 8AM]VXD02868.1 conserved hypothetical protein [Sphingomonas sp. 8AM]
MKISAEALANVLRARGLDLASLSTRSGVPLDRLEKAIDGGADLRDDQIASVAEELAVPLQALFTRQKLPLFPSVDFRTASPSIGKFQKGTLQAISYVEGLSSTLSALDLDLSLDESLAPVTISRLGPAEAEELAHVWRTRWGISDEQQLEWQDANKLYVSLRAFVERLGVLVLHRQFKNDEAAGMYVHIDDGPHTIVINTTNSSKARKLFTLAHEFCHVLIRKEGASNPSIVRNRIERFCNRFAACLLAPKRLVEAALQRFRYRAIPDDDFIRLFAKRLGLSQEATFVRLVQTGHLQRSDYRLWKSKFGNRNFVPSGDQAEKSSGGTPDPLRDKRTQYGTRLLTLLQRARRMGQLDEIDIYRLSGLKPVYQEQLFGAA